MAEYYDYVLTFIPIVFGSLAGSLSVVGVEPPVAIVTASAAAVLIMCHAIFVCAPVTEGFGQDPAAAMTDGSSTN